jgi:hypothetical protein
VKNATALPRQESPRSYSEEWNSRLAHPVIPIHTAGAFLNDAINATQRPDGRKVLHASLITRQHVSPCAANMHRSFVRDATNNQQQAADRAPHTPALKSSHDALTAMPIPTTEVLRDVRMEDDVNPATMKPAGKMARCGHLTTAERTFRCAGNMRISPVPDAMSGAKL